MRVCQLRDPKRSVAYLPASHLDPDASREHDEVQRAQIALPIPRYTVFMHKLSQLVVHSESIATDGHVEQGFRERVLSSPELRECAYEFERLSLWRCPRLYTFLLAAVRFASASTSEMILRGWSNVDP